MGKDPPFPSLTFHDIQWPSMTFYDLLSPFKASMTFYNKKNNIFYIQGWSFLHFLEICLKFTRKVWYWKKNNKNTSFTKKIGVGQA